MPRPSCGALPATLCPMWCGIQGRQVPIGKGCRQGAPESPSLWNIAFDDAPAETVTERQARGYGLYLPANATDAHGKRQRNMADAAARVTHLVYADDVLLEGTSLSEIEDMYRMLHRSVTAKGLKVREEKLELWSSHHSPPRRAEE